jgi:hypothetical protein
MLMEYTAFIFKLVKVGSYKPKVNKERNCVSGVGRLQGAWLALKA